MESLVAAYGSESDAGGSTPAERPAEEEAAPDGGEEAYDPFAIAEASPDVAEGEEPDPNEPLPVEGDGLDPAYDAAHEPLSPARKRAKVELEPGVLPPEPEGDFDLELASRLRAYKAKNLNPTQGIRMNREFNNPQILQKIVDYYGIDDVASNYPTAVFDPKSIVARRSRDKKGKAAAAAPPGDAKKESPRSTSPRPE